MFCKQSLWERLKWPFRPQNGQILLLLLLLLLLLANLYIYTKEIHWYNISRPIFYGRFIDDILYINKGKLDIENFKNIFDFLKLKKNIIIINQKQVQFLDLNI